jgi:RNA polymerase subunit RPABC4/transcription elongation factor Spt4
MRACKECGLSIGDAATFCPVCGTIAQPWEASPTTTPPPASAARDQAVETPAEEAPREEVLPRDAPPEEARAPDAEASRGVLAAADHESEARRCEKTDAPRAAALYRQAIVEYLDSGADPLASPSVRRDVQRLFDRLSLVLKRSDLNAEALEEIDSATYLGLVDDEDCGTKAHREALSKRRDTLRRVARKATLDGA